MGFHQPPQSYVHSFKLTGTDAGVKENARFRTEESDKWKAAGDWSWYENPFMNSTPFRGLIVAQLILNNWDLKTANNRLYEATNPSEKPQRHYMVRDVGASLGHSKQAPFFKMLGTMGSQGTKHDIDGFERQGFIKSVKGDKVSFDYRGYNQKLVDRVTVADVIWACELMAKIPDGASAGGIQGWCVHGRRNRALHQENQGKGRPGPRAEDRGYEVDAGRCNFSSVTRSRCASTASGNSWSAAKYCCA